MDVNKTSEPKSTHHRLTRSAVGGILSGLILFAVAKIGEANDIAWLRFGAMGLFFVAFAWTAGSFLVMVAFLVKDMLNRN